MPQLPLPPQPSSPLHGTGGLTALVDTWAAIGERLRAFELRHYETIFRTARHNPPLAPPALGWEDLVDSGSPFVLRAPLDGVNGDGGIYGGDHDGDEEDAEDDEDGSQDAEDEHDDDDDEHEHEHGEENDNHDEEGYVEGDGIEDGEGEWHHLGRVIFLYYT